MKRILVAFLVALTGCSDGGSSGGEGAGCIQDTDCDATLLCFQGACRRYDCPEMDCPSHWACVEGRCCSQDVCCGPEGPQGDATCDNGEDDDCDGWTDSEDTDCGRSCLADVECHDGDSCTLDSCGSGVCRNVPVGGDCCQGDATFGLLQTYYIGENTDPGSGIVEDFDGDGILDLAIVINNEDNVGILLGNGENGTGDGSFRDAVRYPAGSSPMVVVRGDFDRNGVHDLAVTNYYAGTVSILSGNGDGHGDGTFAAPVSHPLGGNPRELITADFDGDAILDLAVSNPPLGQVQVLRGLEGGGFGAFVGIDAGVGVRGLAAADFDLDGSDDIAVVNEDQDRISVLLGRGDGTFRTPKEFAVQATPQSVTTGDFNSDGLPDLAAGNRGGGTVSVLLNHGGGEFVTRMDIPVGVPETEPREITAADFNGDDILDLAVVADGSDSLAILIGQGEFGRGDGVFEAGEEYLAGNGPHSVTAADFDADGILDLVVTCSTNDELLVFRGQGTCR